MTIITITPETTEYQLEHRRGTHRQVALVPTPFGSRPAIWTSPYEVEHEGKPARVCLVLVAVGPPLPEAVCITVPTDFYDSLPRVPVEW